MKKILSLALLVCLVMSAVISAPITALALTDEEISAPSGILVNMGTGKVLYEKNPDEVMAPASVTKIMTLLLVFESIERGDTSLEDKVATSEHAASMGGTQIWLELGEEFTVAELLKAVCINSANDAAMALAEHVYVSEEAFVAAMNLRASDLGMTNTVFKNPTGLDEEGHVTTARDIALMSISLMEFNEITEYTTIWRDFLRDGETELVNTNKLIQTYEGLTGLKTGTTNDAGSCVSATATRGGSSYVAVVMGCDTSAERFSGATKLLDFGFANYKVIDYNNDIQENLNAKVSGGRYLVCEGTIKEDMKILVGISDTDISYDVVMDENIVAPVKSGDIIGQVIINVNGAENDSFDIVAKSDINRITFLSALKMIAGYLLGFD